MFAADWGGWWDGTCDVSWFVKFIESYLDHARKIGSRARFFANTWGIGFWPVQPIVVPTSMESKEWRAFWDSEVQVCQDFIKYYLPQLPHELGVAFPCHNWYRGFTQKWYRQDEVPDWPDLDTLSTLGAAQRPLCAWTHFIIENDPYHGDLWGRLSVRVRYIRQLIAHLHQAAFEVAMGNVYSGRQALNVFAWAELLRNPKLAVEEVFTRFAEKVVTAPYRDLLVDTLVLLENADPWEQDLPVWSRLPKLQASTLSRQEAAKQWRMAGIETFKRTPLLGLSREIFFDALMQTLQAVEP